MNCRRVNRLLSAYLDGELPGVELRMVHRHLSDCSVCSDEYQKLLGTKRLVSILRNRDPRPELPNLILHRLSEDAPLRRKPTDWMELMTQWFAGASATQRALAATTSVVVVAAAMSLRGPTATDAADRIHFTPRVRESASLLPETTGIPTGFASATGSSPDVLKQMLGSSTISVALDSSAVGKFSPYSGGSHLLIGANYDRRPSPVPGLFSSNWPAAR